MCMGPLLGTFRLHGSELGVPRCVVEGELPPSGEARRLEMVGAQALIARVPLPMGKVKDS